MATLYFGKDDTKSKRPNRDKFHDPFDSSVVFIRHCSIRMCLLGSGCRVHVRGGREQAPDSLDLSQGDYRLIDSMVSIHGGVLTKKLLLVYICWVSC